jgi:hypothetical protein
MVGAGSSRRTSLRPDTDNDPGQRPAGAGQTVPSQCFDLLAESGRHDAWLAWVLDGERRGYVRGHEAGFAAGWAASEANLAASWHAITEPVAHPERGTSRRIQAALTGERRGAAAHERAFVARAYATRDSDRTDAQRAAVFIYPPPAGRGRTR